jgi:hypothetical protein
VDNWEVLLNANANVNIEKKNPFKICNLKKTKNCGVISNA